MSNNRHVFNATGITFYNYKELEEGKRDLVFYTNPSNEDGYASTHISKAQLVNVDEASLVKYDRPSLGFVAFPFLTD